MNDQATTQEAKEIEFFIVRVDSSVEKFTAIATPEDYDDDVPYPSPTYEWLKTNVTSKLFKGPHFETVRILAGNDYGRMWIDETGHLKNLPINYLATAFYLSNLIHHTPIDILKYPKGHVGSFIVGDVIVCVDPKINN